MSDKHPYCDAFNDDGTITPEFGNFLLHQASQPLTEWMRDHPNPGDDQQHAAAIAYVCLIANTAIHGWRECQGETVDGKPHTEGYQA